MAKENVQTAGNSNRANTSDVPGTTAGAKRTLKVYAYEMTERDKMALQTVQRAQSALRVVNDGIKSGTPIKAELLQLCLEINKASVDMLFA